MKEKEKPTTALLIPWPTALKTQMSKCTKWKRDTTCEDVEVAIHLGFPVDEASNSALVYHLDEEAC